MRTNTEPYSDDDLKQVIEDIRNLIAKLKEHPNTTTKRNTDIAKKYQATSREQDDGHLQQLEPRQ